IIGAIWADRRTDVHPRSDSHASARGKWSTTRTQQLSNARREAALLKNCRDWSTGSQCQGASVILWRFHILFLESRVIGPRSLIVEKEEKFVLDDRPRSEEHTSELQSRQYL